MYERKRAKIELKEKLKKEGKWLSKKDLAKKKVADARLQSLIEAGVIAGANAAVQDAEDGRGGALIRKKKAKKNQNEAKDKSATIVEESAKSLADTSAADVDTTTTTV